MAEDKLQLREDFEFARVWLEQLDHLRSSCRRENWPDSSVYNELCTLDSSESKSLLNVYKEGKWQIFELHWLLLEYNQVEKYATLKEYVNYLEKTLESDYKAPLEKVLKDAPQIPEADVDGFFNGSRDDFRKCCCDIIREAKELLGTINDVLNWAKNIKKSGLLDEHQTLNADPDMIKNAVKEAINEQISPALETMREKLKKTTQENDALPLTDTEQNILEALGDNTLTGEKLLKKAGYNSSSHYRQLLSHLHKRGVLGNNGKGYFKQ